MEERDYFIDESTAKVADLVLMVDGLSKKMGEVFYFLYGEPQADKELRRFDKAFEILTKGLIKHLGTNLYESLVEVKEVVDWQNHPDCIKMMEKLFPESLNKLCDNQE